MSKKVVISEDIKQNIIDFIRNTYQCTLNMVVMKFKYSPYILYSNFGKEYLSSILFKGVRDETKKKISKTLTGRKQSNESNLKRQLSCKKVREKESTDKKKQRIERMKITRTNNYGSLKNSYVQGYLKTKQTKLERYSDENYSNIDKAKQTKLERYGDENYNNKDKIRETQFEKYGNYAFTDKQKYEKTMLKKYGVKHNWASKDSKLNGWEARIKKFGSKEKFYLYSQEKAKETKKLLYDDEFYSNTEKAQETMLKKYGVPFYVMTHDCRVITTSAETAQKRNDTKRKNNTFNISKDEDILYEYLISKFSKDDIIREYQDSRYSREDGYKFKCDFYIRPLDLFIELNLHPSHYLHPFDKNNEEDIKRKNLLLSNPTKWNLCCLNVWTKLDVYKRGALIKNKLNYIIFYPKDNYIDTLEEKLNNEYNRV